MDAAGSAYADPVRQIADGSIVIDSVKEFRRILKQFPDDPLVHKAFSDLLVRKRSVQAAAQFYGKSAELYINAGMLAPAIMCRMLQWRIAPPAAGEQQVFYDELQMGSFPHAPAAALFRRLSGSEIHLLMGIMERVQLAMHESVRKIGDEEDALFIVAQGSIKLTTIQPLRPNEREHRTASRYLAEDAFFGEIYPFERLPLSNYYAQAARPVDLIRIDRRRLHKLCKANPRIELGLIDLYRLRPAGESEDYLRMVRRAIRHKLSLKIRMTIRTGRPGAAPISVAGCTRNVSVGGLCVVVAPVQKPLAGIVKDIRSSRVSLALPSGSMAVTMRGAVAWSRNAVWRNQKAVAMGIQFDRMSPRMSGMLMAYAGMVAQAGSKNSVRP